MYARKQSKWVKIRKTYGHSVQVDMYVMAIECLLWRPGPGSQTNLVKLNKNELGDKFSQWNAS